MPGNKCILLKGIASSLLGRKIFSFKITIHNKICCVVHVFFTFMRSIWVKYILRLMTRIYFVTTIIKFINIIKSTIYYNTFFYILFLFKCMLKVHKDLNEKKVGMPL